MQRACEDTFNDCYIELYNILLRAFVAADIDFDGQVSEDEFEGMINAAAAFPKKFGFEWWAGSGKDQFKAIDENGDGAVSFDEWLNFAYEHYKNQKLPVAFDKLEKDQFIADCKDSLNTGSDAYKKVYWFSWKCFQAADADRDGQVSNSEFATMINVATANQKRLGLPAPYQTCTCCTAPVTTQVGRSRIQADIHLYSANSSLDQSPSICSVVPRTRFLSVLPNVMFNV